MPERIIVKINENDNVAVAIHDLPAGAEFLPGLKTREPIPQAHKIALTDIPKGGEIIRYGVVLGYAKKEIPTGSWINGSFPTSTCVMSGDSICSFKSGAVAAIRADSISKRYGPF